MTKNNINKVGNVIDGTHIIEPNRKASSIFNPATGEIIGKVNFSNSDDFNNVISSSKKSFVEWSKVTPLKRSRVLSNYKDLLFKNIENLAHLVSSEHGKTIEDAKGSITRGIEVVEFACGIPNLLKGDFTENVGLNIDSWSIRQPLGVCAGITPFNFPAMVPMWMFPIAIACGNSFILKPSEKNPSCAIKLAELFIEAGLPKGVLNVLNGDKSSVDLLIESDDINSISFVGSTPVAKAIYKKSASFGKRVQALGGAKNHLVIMPDANIEQATDSLIGSAFGSAGQRCMAISVAVAVGNVADKLIVSLKQKIDKLKVAPFTDSTSDMGPVISQEHYKKVINYINSGIEEGAELLIDGRNINIQGYENGYFIGPTLFDNVDDNMAIYKEEIFGPVLSIVRANSYQDALNLINKHQYGNGCSIFTGDGKVSRDFSSSVQIGMVGVNVPIPVPMAFHSFGGWKNSLFGDHGMHGEEGVRFYTKLKTVTSRWFAAEDFKAGFNMPTN